jgi:hypothetical protein
MPIFRELSTPLVELPTYLSTISMVVDSRAAIIQKLTQAERKSPPIYTPARELFLNVIQGRMSFDDAMTQARRLPDDTERKFAVQIMPASEDFLRNERPAIVSELPNLTYNVPNGLPLKIAPVWLRQLSPQRLLVLHFWQTPLSERQLGAAGAALRAALHAKQPQYSSSELDFISVSGSRFSGGRHFERYNWTKIRPLDADGLSRFWLQFLAAWTKYQSNGPREIVRRRAVGLFD